MDEEEDSSKRLLFYNRFNTDDDKVDEEDKAEDYVISRHLNHHHNRPLQTIKSLPFSTRYRLSHEESDLDNNEEEPRPDDEEDQVTSNLDVPKLKDMKSHSFPPPWSREDCDPPSGVSVANDIIEEVASLMRDEDDEEYGNAAVERRRRWILYNHTISRSNG